MKYNLWLLRASRSQDIVPEETLRLITSMCSVGVDGGTIFWLERAF